MMGRASGDHAASGGPVTHLVVLGISGDLARRLLVPALVRLQGQGQLPPLRIWGFGAESWDTGELLAHLEAALREKPGLDLSAWQRLKGSIRYRNAEISPEGLSPLRHLEGPALFYLALPPSLFPKAVLALGELNLAQENTGWRRIAVEKPFGYDLASAQALNRLLQRYFREDQILRVDHFLGKTSVTNLLELRYRNPSLEALWERKGVAWVEITYAETLGLEGRARYYEQAGALRDMLQNHLLQLLALVVMEPPSRLEAASIRAQRAEALRSVQTAEPRLVVRGQYQGYLEEPRVAPDSPRETFVAVRLATHAPRWLGVPFYLRSGKRLAARSGFIFLAFHPSPEGQRGGLLLRLSPEVGLDLTLLGRGKPETLSFRLGPEPEFDAYEEVLLAALSGDLTPFPSQEEVEEAWRVLDPVLKAWEEGEPEVYPQGSEGPGGQMGILKPGHAWVSLRG